MPTIDISTDLALSRAFALLLFWPEARTPSFLTGCGLFAICVREQAYRGHVRNFLATALSGFSWAGGAKAGTGLRILVQVETQSLYHRSTLLDTILPVPLIGTIMSQMPPQGYSGRCEGEDRNAHEGESRANDVTNPPGTQTAPCDAILPTTAEAHPPPMSNATPTKKAASTALLTPCAASA